jgi:glycerol-3-phosphate dehydrogenase
MTPGSSSDFDLIIIGAGINGAGIARDASMRGLRVLLLDKGDIASGTSSASTRLIHGGLRYLEHAEFGLVRESLRERETLLKIAPHLVRPIPILIPIYKNGSRGRTVIHGGLIAYDLLSFDKTLPGHRMLSPAETLEQAPGLNPADLVGSAIYYDCQVEFAERLVLENVLSAKEHGAEILTYSRATKIENGRVEFIRKGSERSEFAKARVVLNAAGPWVDQVLYDSGASSDRLIGGTKGSHIIVQSFRGAPSMAVYIEAESDKRPFFVIPWNQQYLIGTTDVRFEDNPDEVRGELWEVDYLLRETNHVFASAQLKRKDVCYVYSGVRPLPFSKEVDEQRITRRHFIRQHSVNHNLFSILGGKLTTYRNLSEECVDLVFKKLGKRSPRCRTSEIPLPGAVDLSTVGRESEWTSHFPRVVTERLLAVYGSRTKQLIQLCNGRQDLSMPFNKKRDALSAEVIFSFESEMATTLCDCLLRRTMIGMNSERGVGDDEAAAQIARRVLGWSEQKAEQEVADYRRCVAAMDVPDN